MAVCAYVHIPLLSREVYYAGRGFLCHKIKKPRYTRLLIGHPANSLIFYLTRFKVKCNWSALTVRFIDTESGYTLPLCGTSMPLTLTLKLKSSPLIFPSSIFTSPCGDCAVPVNFSPS